MEPKNWIWGLTRFFASWGLYEAMVVSDPEQIIQFALIVGVAGMIDIIEASNS